MAAITHEFKQAIYEALVELGGEADTVQILQKAKTLAPTVDFGCSGDVVRGMRRLEDEGKVAFFSRISIPHNPKSKRKGDSSRNSWRLATATPNRDVEIQRIFFIRCEVSELRKALQEDTTF